MDDKKTGFVNFADIENRWQDDDAKGLPKGVIESLQESHPSQRDVVLRKILRRAEDMPPEKPGREAEEAATRDGSQTKPHPQRHCWTSTAPQAELGVTRRPYDPTT
ncbi:hypothetical protein NQ317_014286 [Molorchus minor]|uniref:Suppressor APC domain-containing protein n=1 Tax=Molorchus minor TaxID=1323400 RepID=A0ABQ9IU69_9CUCU|nr:hypothetical protein NQ317_014286 [Molorchus minor]